jgi:PilZ domain
MPGIEHRREPRQPFFATVELLDAQNETRLEARTSDLSLHGCYVDTTKPFPSGSKVKVTITHSGASFTAVGMVAHSRMNTGMGIAFSDVESTQKSILFKWLAHVHGD